MKKNSLLIICAFALLLLEVGCEKSNLISPTKDEITYEVTLTNCTSWSGAYLSQGSVYTPVYNKPNNWKLTFQNTQELIAVSLQAFPDNVTASSDALMKIYVNNKLVMSGSYKSVGSNGITYEMPN